MKYWLFIILSTLLAFSVSADVPPARANHGCVLLGSTIYCYGGCQRGTPRVALQDGLFYTLDVSKGKSVNDLFSSWALNNATNIGANYYMAMVAIPELNSFLIDGGTREIDSTPQAYTFMYNTTGQGTWNTRIPSGGHLHVDSNTAVTDPGGSNRVYIAGGRTLAVYNITGISQYPTQMVTFDPPSTFGSSVSTLRSLTSQTRLHHKGAFINDGKTIFFIGGIYPILRPGGDGSQYIYAHADMYDILTFDTVTSIWGSRTANGIHPAPRMDHSLTLKSSTNELIVYGGTELESDKPIGDYFYILDVNSLSWSNHSLEVPNGAPSAGPRFGHVAVLVGNSSLFIIFGSNGASTSDLSVLDIDNWSWMTTVPAYILDDTENTGPGDSTNNPPSGLSVGAIAGIAAGSAVFAAAIGAIVMFFILRKRRMKHNGGRDSSVPFFSPSRDPNSGQRTNTPSFTDYDTDSSETRIPSPWLPVTAEVRKSNYEKTPLRDAAASRPLLSVYEVQKLDGGKEDNSTINKRIILTAVKPDRSVLWQ